jgi:hypothetical protein
VSGACNSRDVLHDPCPSLPNLRRRLPSLVRRFTGTTTWSAFSSTCMSALWFMAFADRPSSTDEGMLEISRLSCMLFLSVLGFSRLRRTGQPLAYNAAAVLPFSCSPWSRHSDQPTFRSSIAPPTDASGLLFTLGDGSDFYCALGFERIVGDAEITLMAGKPGKDR